MTKDVDLQESYFNCPELSKSERDHLIHKAQQSAKTLVESARSTNGPVLWAEAGAYKGVQMYKGEARNPAAMMGDEEEDGGRGGGISYACGAVSVQATLEEAADFFDVSTTPKMKQFAATQDDIQDGVVLYTLAAPTPANHNMHQITVKWFLGNMPSRLIKQRDFLTLECQDVFTDTTGRRGWVRSYHSITLPCCPDQHKELGFVRGAMYHSGYVFVESERAGWLDCIFSLQVNLKGNVYLPSALYWISMKSRIKSIARLNRTFKERRLGKQTFLSDLELVPKHQRKKCFLCEARFGVFLHKTRCRKCGQVVCHPCTKKWTVNVPKYGTVQLRVCVKCSATTSQDVLENISLFSEQMESSSVSTASETQYQNQSQSQSQYQSSEASTPHNSNYGQEQAARFPNQPHGAGSSGSEYAGGLGGRKPSFAGSSGGHNNNQPQPHPQRGFDPRQRQRVDRDHRQHQQYEPQPQMRYQEPHHAMVDRLQQQFDTARLDQTFYSDDDGKRPPRPWDGSAAAALDASALERHTRQMGPPGPVMRQHQPQPPHGGGSRGGVYRTPPMGPQQQQMHGPNPHHERMVRQQQQQQQSSSSPYYQRYATPPGPYRQPPQSMGMRQAPPRSRDGRDARGPGPGPGPAASPQPWGHRSSFTHADQYGYNSSPQQQQQRPSPPSRGYGYDHRDQYYGHQEPQQEQQYHDGSRQRRHGNNSLAQGNGPHPHSGSASSKSGSRHDSPHIKAQQDHGLEDSAVSKATTAYSSPPASTRDHTNPAMTLDNGSVPMGVPIQSPATDAFDRNAMDDMSTVYDYDIYDTRDGFLASDHMPANAKAKGNQEEQEQEERGGRMMGSLRESLYSVSIDDHEPPVVARQENTQNPSSKTIMELYEKILELTTQQHALGNQASDLQEKHQIAQELQDLYRELSVLKLQQRRVEI